MTRALIIFYFLILFGTLMVTSKTVQGPWLFLFRAFFPNWKFYHSLGWQPQLYVRIRYPGRSEISGDHSTAAFANPSPSPWTESRLIYPRAKRNLLNLFHNPTINIALAHQNLVEHLANDLQAMGEQEDPKNLVSYKLVNRFVRSSIYDFISGAHQAQPATDFKLPHPAQTRAENQPKPNPDSYPDSFPDSSVDWFDLVGERSIEYQFEIRLKLNSPEIKSRIQLERDNELAENPNKNEHEQSAQAREIDEIHVLMSSPILKLLRDEGARPQVLLSPGSQS